MNFEEYQKRAGALAEYPDVYVFEEGCNEDGKESDHQYNLSRYVYPALGLVGEAGEVAEKIKKIVRNNNGKYDEDKKNEIKKELGDVLWYIQQLCTEFGLSMDHVAWTNISKLEDRKERNVIKGEGDNR